MRQSAKPAAGSMEMTYRAAVDIGGTFTDLVFLGEDGQVHSKKVLSTPADYSEGIENAVTGLLSELGAGSHQILSIAHGTTIATNTIIERKGAKVALITTKGFRDVLELARFRAPKLYDLSFRKSPALVERRMRFEITERIDASGQVLTPVVLEELVSIAQQINAEGIEAVAICLLHSYANPAHERKIAEELRKHCPNIPVSASVDIMPQIQEYERTSTAVVNAYVRPRMQTYLERLAERLVNMGIHAPLMIMQSSGGLLPAPEIALKPVLAIESGPAAGVVGASVIGNAARYRDLIVLDIGGTTAKASLIDDGQYAMTPEIEVGSMQSGSRLIKGGGYTVQAPTIDLAEIGAGGGSIAKLDQASALRVGPESAGAFPGPACYQLGGVQATLTDANVFLGYLSQTGLAGGELSIDASLSRSVIGKLAVAMGMDAVTVAYGIHQLANASIMRVLRSVSSERGRDPADFTMFAIGGNGPLHGATLAAEMKMKAVVIPPVAGVFSALGMISSKLEYQKIVPFYQTVKSEALAGIRTRIQKEVNDLHGVLAREGHADTSRHEFACELSLQYSGQVGTIPLRYLLPDLNVASADQIDEAFHREHTRVFGYRSNEIVRITSVRISGRVVDAAKVGVAIQRTGRSQMQPSARQAYFGPDRGWMRTSVLRAADLTSEQISGPVIVEEYDTTTLVPPGWSIRIDTHNNMMIEVEA